VQHIPTSAGQLKMMPFSGRHLKKVMQTQCSTLCPVAAIVQEHYSLQPNESWQVHQDLSTDMPYNLDLHKSMASMNIKHITLSE
jgi:hypothetical protein